MEVPTDFTANPDPAATVAEVRADAGRALDASGRGGRRRRVDHPAPQIRLHARDQGRGSSRVLRAANRVPQSECGTPGLLSRGRHPDPQRARLRSDGWPHRRKGRDPQPDARGAPIPGARPDRPSRRVDGGSLEVHRHLRRLAHGGRCGGRHQGRRARCAADPGHIFPALRAGRLPECGLVIRSDVNPAGISLRRARDRAPHSRPNSRSRT